MSAYRANRPENEDGDWFVHHDLNTYQPLVDQYDALGNRISGQWDPIGPDTIVIYNLDVKSVWLAP